MNSWAALSLALSLPLSATQVKQAVDAQGIHDVGAFLEALPAPLHQSFVLMHASRSRQQATPDHPRQILFGSDARFLVAVSGVPGDPLANEVEMAEFDPAAGVYHFDVLRFPASGPPELQVDVPVCAGCHGTPTRPIWGQYPDWTGAYGDETGRVAADVQAGFAAFLQLAPTLPVYRHLALGGATPSGTFLLTAHDYPYPNTDFNHELGNTVALGVDTRLAASPRYAALAPALLATSPSLSCVDDDAWPDLVARVRTVYDQALAADPDLAARYGGRPTRDAHVLVYRLLGLDAEQQLSLERLDVDPGAGTAGAWLTGAYQLEDAVAFRTLLRLFPAVPGLEAAFASERETIDDIARHAELTGEARAAALARSSAWYDFWDVFAPVWKSPARLETVCGLLLSRTPTPH